MTIVLSSSSLPGHRQRPMVSLAQPRRYLVSRRAHRRHPQRRSDRRMRPRHNVLQLVLPRHRQQPVDSLPHPDGNWSAEAAHRRGVLNGDPIALRPGTNILHLFYRGGDNGLWTRWRDPRYLVQRMEIGRPPQRRSDRRCSPRHQRPPGFYRGLDNNLRSRWRTPGRNGHWTGEQQIWCGVLNGDPIAARSPARTSSRCSTGAPTTVSARTRAIPTGAGLANSIRRAAR